MVEIGLFEGYGDLEARIIHHSFLLTAFADFYKIMPSRATQTEFAFAYQDRHLHTNSSRNIHIRKLNDILHLSIERNDIPRALRTWSILARCKEFDWRRDWRTAFLLLKSGPGSAQWPKERTTGFLRRTMRTYPEEVWGYSGLATDLLISLC